MSNSTEEPWSTNPNAPKIPKDAHLDELSFLPSVNLSAISLGVVVVIFFHCMEALLSPNRRGQRGVKWPLVAHTVAMFSFVTVSVVTGLYVAVINFIDNRDFPGVSGILAYNANITSTPIGVVSNTPFFLNGLLADGLLLYRCHVIYAMNYWVVAFPCLLYVSSIGAGIVYIFEDSHPLGSYWNGDGAVNFGPIYLSISLSLNVILTAMIVTRLFLHNRILRNAVGPLSSPGGFTKFANTILIESCALSAVTSLVYIGSWGTGNYQVVNYIIPIFEATQVIGPFLIILRVANRTAVTTDAGSGRLSSIRFGSKEESTESDGSSADETSGDSAEGYGETHGEVSLVGTENGVEEAPR